MKKVRAIAAVCLVAYILVAACLVVLGVWGGIGSRDNFEGIALDKDRYILFLDGEKTASPIVKASRAYKDYSLISSNVTIFSVGEDGIITGIKEGIAKLTAAAGDKRDSSTVIVYKSSASALIPKEDDGKLLVVFVTELSGIPAQRVLPGETAVEPESPNVPDQVIEGWYTDEKRTKRYDFSTPITSDITLYAKWTAGDNPTFVFKTVSGTHTIDKLKYPLVAFETIVLPSVDYDGKPVTAVNSKAFQDYSFVQTIIVPKEITTIKDFAFAGCTNLKMVIFEEGSKLKTIENEAFWKCTSLENITLPDGLTKLGAGAFNECAKLASVNLPNGITTIEKQVFAKTAIESIDLVNVTTLKSYAFSGATKLQEVKNPDKLIKVEMEVFTNTAWLTNAINAAPDGVAYLGKVLITCKNATFIEIMVKSGTTLIANNALYNITNGIIRFVTDTPPVRGDNATRTEGGASSSITANKLNIVVPKDAYATYKANWSICANQIYYQEIITIDGSLSTLELFVRKGFSHNDSTPKDSAVLYKYNGNGDTTLNIKNILKQHVGTGAYLERIRAGAFYQDNNLQSVILPTRLGEIESFAFNYCRNLSIIRLEGDESKTDTYAKLETNSCFSNLHESLKIYLPDYYYNKVKDSTNWSSLDKNGKLQSY